MVLEWAGEGGVRGGGVRGSDSIIIRNHEVHFCDQLNRLQLKESLHSIYKLASSLHYTRYP